MKYFFVILISLNLLSCKQTLHNSIEYKITIFNRHENTHLKNICIDPIRNQPKQDPLEFFVTQNGISGRAIIQVQPERKIIENFNNSTDSQTKTLIDLIDSLEIRFLMTIKDTVQMDFYFEDEYIILYRKSRIRNYSKHRNAKSVQFNEDWAYVKIKQK